MRGFWGYSAWEDFGAQAGHLLCSLQVLDPVVGLWVWPLHEKPELGWCAQAQHMASSPVFLVDEQRLGKAPAGCMGAGRARTRCWIAQAQGVGMSQCPWPVGRALCV